MTENFELDLSKMVSPPAKLTHPELVLLYGNFGSGKTHLAMSAADVKELSPVLVIDLEGSTTGVSQHFPGAEVIRIKEKYAGNEWAATTQLLDKLLTQTHKYKTVVIDPLNVLFEWGKEAGDQPGDGFAKWTFVHNHLTSERGYISKLKHAPFLGILVLHEAKEVDEDTGISTADFRWQGQGKSLLGQYPDLVGYVTRDTNAAGVSTSTLHTAPSKKNSAKNRFGLPAKIVDPSMGKILHLIKNKEKKED